MKMIARLSQVALASAAMMLPIASHAALSNWTQDANQAAWSGWTHQVYVGVGGGFQYLNNKTVVGNIYDDSSHFDPGFHAHRYAGMGNLSLGLANTQGVDYWAVEFDATHSSAYNNAMFNADIAGVPVFTNTYSLVTSMPWRYELDGVFGRYIQPNVLAYVKGGATMGRMFTTFTAHYNYNEIAFPTVINLNKIMYGVVVGAGAQYVANTHWRVGGEVDVVQFFNGHKYVANYLVNNTPAQIWGTNGANFQIRQTNLIAKATVSYMF